VMVSHACIDDEVVQKNGVMEGEAAGAKRASDLLVGPKCGMLM
jgi:hypothetical protein